MGRQMRSQKKSWTNSARKTQHTRMVVSSLPKTVSVGSNRVSFGITSSPPNPGCYELPLRGQARTRHFGWAGTGLARDISPGGMRLARDGHRRRSTCSRGLVALGSERQEEEVEGPASRSHVGDSLRRPPHDRQSVIHTRRVSAAEHRGNLVLTYPVEQGPM